MTYQGNLKEIERLAKEMSDLYDLLPGKENLKAREALLKPLRAKVVDLHYRQIEIVRQSRPLPTLPLSKSVEQQA